MTMPLSSRDDDPRRPRLGMAVRGHRAGATLVLAVCLPLVVALVLVPLRSSFANTAAALVLVGVVTGVAALGSRLAGVVATISSSIWFDFFLTRPYDRLAITHRNDIETTVTLFVVGLAITEIAVRSRHARERAATSGGEVALLYETAEMLAGGASPRLVAGRVAAMMVDLLGLEACRFETGPSERHPARLGHDGEVRWAGAVWSVAHGGFPGRELEVVAEYQGTVYGRFVCTPIRDRPVPLDRRIVAVSLAAQVGAALAHHATAR